MASPRHNRGRSTSPQKPSASQKHQRNMSAQSFEDDSLLNSRHLEAFGRTVHATASQLISANFTNPDHGNTPEAYRSALSSVHRSMRRPAIQRGVFSFAKANPRELLRSNFNTAEIEHRALTFLPDELIQNAPESSSPFSLLDGFRASLPEDESDKSPGRRKKQSRRSSRGQKLLGSVEEEEKGPPGLVQTKRDKARLDHRLEMMGIRKTMCSSEIREIDTKIANLNTMRRVVLDRLAGLEQEENDLEQEIATMAEKLDELQELFDSDEAAAAATAAAAKEAQSPETPDVAPNDLKSPGFMSESIYEKLPTAKESPSPRNKRKKAPRRTISMPVLHEHMESGSRIREMQAHNDMITAIDFDAPFGTMVTAALDDTVRVWDLNAGRCIGMLEGHLSSVRCLQVEDTIVATGSSDASIRLWDLSLADYSLHPVSQSSNIHEKVAEEDEGDERATAGGADLFTTPDGDPAPPAAAPEPSADAMADCHLFTLSSHVSEITALHFRGSTLVSGSADKTLRQWDLEKGRCVQTLDVLWAAAQASSVNPNISAMPGSGSRSNNSANTMWRPTGGRLPAAEADFVGALQVFDSALACGTADGMVRLWDLRSGTVHRSLVGHTGPVTALQFDDVYLVTGSQDRSIRIWDLRTGTIHDAFAYDHPIASMQFDARRIVAAAGEPVVKVYDKTDGNHWSCGAGALTEESLDGAAAPSIVERVRIKDGYLVEGRKDGVVGVWSC
ncbi:mitochondrial division protein 1 [Acrodontium crateriforme]|uniref:Mitochondrial division protein 1 n=1 Tax=Acrodontium crateriforme TaxID=150365 RepID=A0AAQ3MBJ5_9PEZI|nr:mitochondrial division protein 1 [Acrodontium crateriforme]